MRKRYCRDIELYLPPATVEYSVQEYLRLNKFKFTCQKGEDYFKTSGFWVPPKGFKYVYQNGILHIEAWIGKIGKEIDIGDGKYYGSAAKVPYLNSVYSLLEALGKERQVQQQQTMQYQNVNAQAGGPVQAQSYSQPYTQPNGPAQPQMNAQPNGPAQPQMYTQPNGPAQPQMYTQPNGPAQPQMYTQPNGPAQPQMYAQPNGPAQPQMYAQPNGPAQPQMYAQPNGPAQPQMYAQPNGPAQPQMYGQPNGPVHINTAVNSIAEDVNKANEKYAVIAFILSIAALVLLFVSRYSLMANLGAFVCAIRFGLNSRKRGLAVAAIILSSIDIVLTIGIVILNLISL
jgi:hypothetical protein